MRLSFLTVLDISTKKNPTKSRTYLTTDSDVSEENRQKGNVSEKWGFQPEESREQDLSCWSFAINTKFTSRETKCLSRKTKIVDVGVHELQRHSLSTRCQERFNTWLLRLRDMSRCLASPATTWPVVGVVRTYAHLPLSSSGWSLHHSVAHIIVVLFQNLNSQLFSERSATARTSLKLFRMQR